MQRVHGVIRDIEPHDSVERYTGLGVEVLQGHARITSPWTRGGRRWPTAAHAHADHAQHRHRRRRQPLRAADPGPGGGRLPDQRHGVGPDASCRGAWWCWAAARSAASWRRASRGWAAQVTQVEMAPRIWCARTPRSRSSWRRRCAPTACDVLTGHEAVRVEVVGRREAARSPKHDGRGGARSPSTSCCAPWAAARASPATAWRSWASRSRRRKTIETNAYLQTLLPQHLRRGRRGRAVPVHAHGRAPGLVRRGQRAVRPLPQVQGRLLA